MILNYLNGLKFVNKNENKVRGAASIGEHALYVKYHLVHHNYKSFSVTYKHVNMSESRLTKEI